MDHHYVWRQPVRLGNGVDVVNILGLLFPRPKNGHDLYQTYGTAISGNADLSWTASRILDNVALRHLVDDAKEPFNVEEWGRRKQSQAAAQMRTGLVAVLDYFFYARWYPKIGKAIYNNVGTHLAYESVKSTVNFLLVRWMWYRLKQ